jgi:dihydrolipoamide dehydrogenase
MRSTDGFFKIITTNEKNPLILGMRAAGPQSDAATIFIAAHIDSGSRLEDMLKTVHPHPSMSEGIQECLRIISHKSILKPKAFPKNIEFKEWSPDK